MIKRGFLGLKGHIVRNIASVVGVVAVAAATFLSPGPATAENGQIAAGVVGGLIGGALLGGAPGMSQTCQQSTFKIKEAVN
jgi:hypothetical protein